MSEREQPRRLRTETHKAKLVAANGSMEWSAYDQVDIPMVSLCFRGEENDRLYWKKLRIFSASETTREKSLIALREIDRATFAGGRLYDLLISTENIIEAGEGIIEVMDSDFMSTLEPVMIVWAESESINRTTGRLFVSSHISRVRMWLHNAKSSAMDHRQLSDFCYTREWLDVRQRILNQFGSMCMCCGATSESRMITVDHIYPRSRYPTLALTPSNLQVLCSTCNREKSDGSMVNYRTDEQDRQADALDVELARGIMVDDK